MPHPCRRVLVVEDDEDVRASVLDFLAMEDIEGIPAASGPEALARLERGPSPDVVLVDLGMPGMSGAELVERIKADERWSAMPVAVMSGFARNHFQYLQADDYIEKPFDLERLNDALSRLCRVRQERLAAE